ncbi:MAG: T9SS type A sorting domain-containing protein [Candidatus Stygibacter australis]|nr:T9SS type A sorting domain-containing protein [Candidatus Stygibacter australis]MDP8322973.1 T9SS type A sorting domain-containing protein [Candidatus Stygibacter australis]
MRNLKKYIVMLFALLPVILCSTILYVDDEYSSENAGGHTWGVDAFDNIPDAIGEFEDGDCIWIYPCSTGDWVQNSIMIYNKSVHMVGIGDVTIRGAALTAETLYLNFTGLVYYTITLENLTLSHTSNNMIIRLIYDTQRTSLDFSECTFTNYGASSNPDMISIENAFQITITDCVFENEYGDFNAIRCHGINQNCREIVFTDNQITGGSLYFDLNGTSAYNNLIDGNVFIGCRSLCHISCYDYDVQLEISNNLVYDIQDFLNNYDYPIYLATDGDDDVEISVLNNTFVPDPDNTLVVAIFGDVTEEGMEYPDTDITNNIFWGFDYIIRDDTAIPEAFDIDYNCCNVTLNDAGAGDTNNITGNPQFVDAGSDDYNLDWDSPCMDSGDQSFDEDADGTECDMGCLVARDHDNVIFIESETGDETYVWRGFPRLDVVGDENGGEFVEATDMFDYFEYPDRPDPIEVWYQNNDPDYEDLHGDWDTNEYDWDPDPSSSLVKSTRGYKVKVWDDASETSLLRVFGHVIEADTYITVDVSEDENWFCYFPEDTQDAEDAFDSTTLSQLDKIWTKNWTATKNGGTWTWPGNATLRYGETVIIRDVVARDFSFQWQQPARDIIEPYERPEPTQFSYNEDIEYFPIFMEFTEVPLEVAVYVDNVCKGAEVVDSDSLFQLRAYVLEEEPGYELEFVFYNGRSETKVMDYRIDNSFSQYSTDRLITGNLGDYVFIEFGEPLSDQVPELETNLKTYPNPFNPTVQLSFQAGQYGKYDLVIYNLKGQKVRTIIENAYCTEGERIEKVWKGLDNNGKQVSGGVYFIRLISPYDEQVSKIVLLK